MNQKVMCFEIWCSNAKMLCCKNKSLTGILTFMEGYSSPISSVGQGSSYTQDQHISQKLDLDAFKLPNNFGNKVLHMKFSSTLPILFSAFYNNWNHWNLSSDVAIHRNMKHLKSILTVIGCLWALGFTLGGAISIVTTGEVDLPNDGHQTEGKTNHPWSYK